MEVGKDCENNKLNRRRGRERGDTGGRERSAASYLQKMRRGKQREERDILGRRGEGYLAIN